MNKILQDRRLWIGAVVLAVVVLILLLRSLGSGSAELPTVAVKAGPFEINLVETGEIRATHSVDIKAPMEWRMDLQIVEMAEEGALVDVGDVLVRFDVSTLEEKLDAAKDELTSAHAEMQRLSAEQASRMSQLQDNLAMAEYSKQIAVVQLQQLQFESEVKREDARLALKKAEVELEKVSTEIESQKIIDKAARGRVQLQIAQAEAEVGELQRKIDTLTLRAPIAGMVVYNEIGSWNSRHKVAIGDKPRPGQAVVSIPNLDEMEVVIRVNEMDASKISVGQKTNVRLDAYSNKIFTGTVKEVAKLAQKENNESEVKDFQVVVQIEGTDPVLKPGMTAQAQIKLAQIDSAMYIPIGTVYEQNGEAVVFLQKSYPNPVRVLLGERNDQYIVVKGGLSEDSRIVWKAPSADYHRLGWAATVLARKNADERLVEHFAAMVERGLGYDYDAHRNKRVLASADSASGDMDVESMMAKIKAMRAKGGPIELDPKMLKELRSLMRGKRGQIRMQKGNRREGAMKRTGAPPRGSDKMIIAIPDSGTASDRKAPAAKDEGIDSLRNSPDKTSGSTRILKEERQMMKELRKEMRRGNKKRR